MKTNHKLWAIFSVFVWLHLMPAALWFPWALTSEIRSDAESAVEAEKFLSPDNIANKSIEEWEQDLTDARWLIWIESTALVIFGLVFSWLLFCNTKRWPYLLGTLTAVTTFWTLPPLIEMFTSSDHTFIGYMEVWINIIGNNFRKGEGLSYFFTTYSLFAWPFYSLALLMFSLTQIWGRWRDRTAAA